MLLMINRKAYKNKYKEYKYMLFSKFIGQVFLWATQYVMLASRMGSYAWKSILRGRDIIQRGALWRVGSGEKINIWQHRWLPRKHPTLQPICPLESFENHKVDSLIDPSTRRWNE